MGFIKKVYGILSCQMLATTLIATACILYTPLQLVLIEHAGLFRFFLLIPTIFVLITMMCFKNSYPLNMILDVGFICAVVSQAGMTNIILEAFFLTGMIF